jgi:hypothetical protein
MNSIILTNSSVAPVIPVSNFHTAYLPRIKGHRPLSQAWRFQPDDRVYVRGWPSSAVVIRRVAGLAWPHYVVMDGEGDLYRVSQLYISTKPTEVAA